MWLEEANGSIQNLLVHVGVMYRGLELYNGHLQTIDLSIS